MGRYLGDPIREPLELIVAALIYLNRGLQAFSDETIHERVRGPGPPLGPILARDARDLLAADLDREEMLGRMNLASAALRLPVAVLETIDANPTAAEEFDGLIDCDNWFWNDKAVQGRLPSLACCPEPLNAPSALAVVMLIRQDFGHGEKPKGTKGKSSRERCLNKTYRCRRVEAEQCLIGWALEKLQAAPK